MGNAGTVDFPTYMKTVHNNWLDHTGTDTVTSSVVDRINAATSPYSGVTPNNPATELNAIDTAVSAFSSLFTGLSPETEWEEAITGVEQHLETLDLFSDAHIAASADTFADVQDDQINYVILPRFRAGLRNVNAVLSSSFVMGQALIEGMRNRDVAKYQAELREKLEILRPDFVGKVVDSILRHEMTILEMRKLLLHYQMEAQRLRIVAEKEYADGTTAIAVGNAKWPFEVFQLSANILGSIGGGTAVYGDTAKGPSTLQSALSGAISGAALGMQLGGGSWTGAAMGGGLGLLLGGLD